MSDGPVLKPTLIYVSSDLLTREQFISAQEKELVLSCSKSFSVEEAAGFLFLVYEIMRNIAIAMQQVIVDFVTGHIDTK
jgi:hypothetical protein